VPRCPLYRRYPGKRNDSDIVKLDGGNAVVGRCHDRHENQWQGDTEQHARPRDEPEAEIAVHVGHAVHRERDENSAGDDQIFGLHQLWQELRGREQNGAGREHHQEAGAELAACYHPKVDQALQR
jgi:hypothetical protein